MQNKTSLLNDHSQNDKLRIRIVSPDFGHLTTEHANKIGLTHRMPYYFILFMLDGSTKHSVDLEEFNIESNQLLFVLPHQIHRLPDSGHGIYYLN